MGSGTLLKTIVCEHSLLQKQKIHKWIHKCRFLLWTGTILRWFEVKWKKKYPVISFRFRFFFFFITKPALMKVFGVRSATFLSDILCAAIQLTAMKGLNYFSKTMPNPILHVTTAWRRGLGAKRIRKWKIYQRRP